MSPSVIENFVVGIITSVVTAVAFWLWGTIRKSQIMNRRSAFFGISPKENCLVVMNHSARDQNVMAHGDVETLIEVVRLVDEIGAKLVIARFDRILEPAGEMTEFCIGGPDSNQRTKVHLENFLKAIVRTVFIWPNGLFSMTSQPLWIIKSMSAPPLTYI